MRLKFFVFSLLHTLTFSAYLTVVIPASAALPNPAVLPPSTTGSLSSLANDYTAPLSSANAFSFRNVSSGSYLFSVHCTMHAFGLLHIAVADDGAVAAWATFRGNAWENKGDMMAVSAGNTVEAQVHSVKNYYMERAGFSPLSLLRNPMILIAGVSMLIVFGLPYLMDNMDPEMRAEFEERQKQSPISGLLAGQQPGANPIANFDAAAWLAGTSVKKSASGSGQKR